jgi:hypothetical protein
MTQSRKRFNFNDITPLPLGGGAGGGVIALRTLHFALDLGGGVLSGKRRPFRVDLIVNRTS